MSRRLKLEAWLHARREAWRAAVVKGPVTGFAFEFVSFGVKQAWCCLFGGLMLALLVGGAGWLWGGLRGAVAVKVLHDLISAVTVIVSYRPVRNNAGGRAATGMMPRKTGLGSISSM